jgi:hypothetical protein
VKKSEVFILIAFYIACMKPISSLLCFALIILSLQELSAQPLENPEATYPSRAYEELYLKEPRFFGEEVKTLQRFLLFMGLDIGPDGIDGWFGPDTEKAVLQFQEGLPDMRRSAIPRYIYTRPLHWEPFWISYFEKEPPKRPSAETALLTERVEVDNTLPQDASQTLRSYFGAINWSRDYIRYHAIQEAIYSPDRRFLYFLTSLPTEVQRNGPTKIVIWDLLSGQSFDFHVIEAFFLHGSWYTNRQDIDYSGISSPRIQKANWHPPLDSVSSKPGVILEIEAVNDEGTIIKALLEIQPYRYDF